MSDASSLALHKSDVSSRSSFVRHTITKETEIGNMTDSKQGEMEVDLEVGSQYEPRFGVGMRPSVQELYRPNDRLPWGNSVLEKPKEDLAAGSYAQECALIVRRELDPMTKQGALHSITVQSPLVREVLDRTFDGYEGINTQLREVTFKAPFHPFYHRWSRFQKLCEDERNEEVKIHLDLLHGILSDEITPHIETMGDMVKNRVISFDYLWTIFAPGMQVYTTLDGQDRVLTLDIP